MKGNWRGRVITLNEKKLDWKEDMTVSDLLSGIQDAHLYWIVKINDQYITKPHFDTVTIPDECEIILVPMFAGG